MTHRILNCESVTHFKCLMIGQLKFSCHKPLAPEINTTTPQKVTTYATTESTKSFNLNTSKTFVTIYAVYCYFNYNARLKHFR